MLSGPSCSYPEGHPESSSGCASCYCPEVSHERGEGGRGGGRGVWAGGGEERRLRGRRK